MEKRLMIIGAGASGRGHLGQLALESGWELVFVDKDRALVEALRRSGRYEVRLVGPRPRNFAVDPFEVLHLDERDRIEAAFARCPLVFTCVCPNNLRDVADYFRPIFIRWLAAGGRDTKDVLSCENMESGTRTFRRFLIEGMPAQAVQDLDERVGFSDSMIARVVAKPKDPLRLLGEEYSEWTADRKALRGPVPSIRTLEFVDDQERYLQRKLFIHNTGHATFGYLGFLRGYTYIHEAARDPEIFEAAEKAIEESGWAIEREHGFDAATILAYRKALLDKCPSEALPDEISRVVREPLRKLGPAERFFGPIALLLKHGREPRHILAGPCAAILSDIPGDVESGKIRRIAAESGLRGVLEAAGVRVPDSVAARMEEVLQTVRKTFARWK